jgi:predicted phosphodiesterase
MSALRLIWLNDLHLNFLDPEDLDKFLKRLSAQEIDAILIAGDIGEADSLETYLASIEQACKVPVYFVLGNHDYYRGSIRHVRKKLQSFLLHHPRLIWLNTANIISLNESLALIGHDSWADGRLGDYWNSTVRLNDFVLIGEFLGKTQQQDLEIMQALAQEAARHFEAYLPQALMRHSKVIILTHVPPFAEATWHQGQMSSPEWMPFFSAKIVGDVIKKIMADHPQHKAVVFCGHTHSPGVFQALPNLEVVTKGAVYGKPRIPRVMAL